MFLPFYYFVAFFMYDMFWWLCLRLSLFVQFAFRHTLPLPYCPGQCDTFPHNGPYRITTSHFWGTRHGGDAMTEAASCPQWPDTYHLPWPFYTARSMRHLSIKSPPLLHSPPPPPIFSFNQRPRLRLGPSVAPLLSIFSPFSL